MYAVAYLTPGGFSSVGFIGDFEGSEIRVADPVFGWQTVADEDCFAVIHTETGYVLPGVTPMLSESLTSPWLMPRAEKLAANKVIRGPWPKRHRKMLLEPELGGDKFVSGYPHAWERIQRWASEVAPDWRSLALSAIFARCSIQRPIEEAEMLYRQFGPTLRDALLRGSPPSPEQMMRWRGIRNTRAMKREGGLDDLRSFQDIMAWAPWCAELLKSRDDLSRGVRDVIALEWLPWGIGVAKLSFTMMLSGRDAACLDTRMLNYFFGDATFDPAELEAGDDYASNARKWTEPETRLQFLSRVSSRSTAEGARGVTAGAVKTYSWLEGKLSQTPYFDPDWPQPYAKAQWMLWETLGRTAGTANHGALWEVIDPLIEEITGRPLERNSSRANAAPAVVLRGEELIEETTNADGHAAMILRSERGIILREWDDVHGWGDRLFRTMAAARARLKPLSQNPDEREWLSPQGKRQVVAVEGTRVAIRTEGSSLLQVLPISELESEIRRDVANAASRRRAQQAQQEVAEEHRHRASWLGFTDDMPPASRARADQALSKQMVVRGALASRGDHIIGLVKEGFRVITGPRGRELRSPTGSFFYEQDLTKTGLDFADYLSRT